MTTPLVCKEIITGPMAWRGPELMRDQSWIYHLTSSEIAELDAALRKVQARNVPLLELRGADFDLPAFGPKLRELLEDIRIGRGFTVIRGLPVERYSDEEVGLIYWGIGALLGIPVSQNRKGDFLGHVYSRDERAYGKIDVRGYESNAHLPFHNDSSDVVGLLCLRKAKAGGLSSIVGAAAMHNEILTKHPEYLEPLYRGYYYIQREDVLQGKPLTERPVPVFGYKDGYLSARLVRNQINSAAAFTGKPLEPLELAALDFMAELYYSPDFHLAMDLLPGDIQLLNNYTTMHSRTQFEDFPEPERKRHMLRLWLNIPWRRPVPDTFFDYREKGYKQLYEVAA